MNSLPLFSNPWFRSGAFAVGLLGLLVACRPAEKDEDMEATLWSISISISTNEITAGDPVRLRIDAVHPTRTRVDWPTLSETFRVRDEANRQELVGEGKLRSTRLMTITAFRTGSHRLTKEPLKFRQPDDSLKIGELPDIHIEVRSLLSEEEIALQPIRDPLEWPSRIPRWVYVFSGVTMLAFLAGLGVAYWMKREPALPEASPPPPPHDKARKALWALLAKGYIEQGLVEPFYTELSLIVRQYLEDRFMLRAPESTTEEFIRDAGRSGALSPDHQSLVNDFLQQCDLVKFARFRPTAQDMETAYAAADRLVTETIRAHTETHP